MPQAHPSAERTGEREAQRGANRVTDLDMNDPEELWQAMITSAKRLTFLALLCWAVACVYLVYLGLA
jgi:hypothetical protein